MIECERCGLPSEFPICFDCANPEEFIKYYYRNDMQYILGLPYGKQLYQPIDGLDLDVHRKECEDRLKLLQKLEYKDKAYVDLGCANGYFPLHLDWGLQLGIDHSKDDIILALKTRDMMGISDETTRFTNIKLTPYNISTYIQHVDVVTCLSLIHHWAKEFGIDGAKIMLRYVFGAKEIILEQGSISYQAFVKWTGIEDFYPREFSMNNPLVLHLMVKACIGFVPDFEILGETNYTQADGVSYPRIMIKYNMDTICNKINIHDNGQSNVLYKYGDRVFKFIPNLLKRNADVRGNIMLGRNIRKHGDVFSMPYFKQIDHKLSNDQIADAMNDALDRLIDADIIHNEFFKNAIFTGDRLEPIDFETAVMRNDYADFLNRLEGKDILSMYDYCDIYYFRSQSARYAGTNKINQIFKEYIEYDRING